MEKRLLRTGRAGPVVACAGAATALRQHLDYIEGLLNTRDWLAGRRMSLADFAAAAHLSVIDYFGDVPWKDFPIAQDLVHEAEVQARLPTHPGRSLAGPARRSRTMTISTSSHPNESPAGPRSEPKPLRPGLRRLRASPAPRTPGPTAAGCASSWPRASTAAMGWMEETLDRRAHPTAMWQDARDGGGAGRQLRPRARPAAGAGGPLARGDHASTPRATTITR